MKTSIRMLVYIMLGCLVAITIISASVLFKLRVSNGECISVLLIMFETVNILSKEIPESSVKTAIAGAIEKCVNEGMFDVAASNTDGEPVKGEKAYDRLADMIFKSIQEGEMYSDEYRR